MRAPKTTPGPDERGGLEGLVSSACGTRRARRSAVGDSQRAGARAGLWCAGVAVSGLATDAASKAWALSALRDGHRITVAGGLLRLQLVINHGAAARYEPLLAAAGLAGVVLLGLWAARASSGAGRSGAALAAGGAAGNMFDN
jgi:lipoprotein signal peptidase